MHVQTFIQRDEKSKAIDVTELFKQCGFSQTEMLNPWNRKSDEYGVFEKKLKGCSNPKVKSILPKNPDDLLEICNLSVSNFKNTKVNKVALTDNARNENKINKPIKDAWKTKAEQAINQLTIYSRTDDFIRQQVELLKLELVEDKKGWFK